MFDLSSIERFEQIATPFYYYDMELLDRTLDTLVELSGKYGVKVHYAVKANVERRILQKISARGLGADCVSGNEVARAIECGFPPESGCFPTRQLRYAAMPMRFRSRYGTIGFSYPNTSTLEVSHFG